MLLRYQSIQTIVRAETGLGLYLHAGKERCRCAIYGTWCFTFKIRGSSVVSLKFVEKFDPSKTVPQRLKPINLGGSYGTAEAVPFQTNFFNEIQRQDTRSCFLSRPFGTLVDFFPQHVKPLPFEKDLFRSLAGKARKRRADTQ
jgi:hypothetical protein